MRENDDDRMTAAQFLRMVDRFWTWINWMRSRIPGDEMPTRAELIKLGDDLSKLLNEAMAMKRAERKAKRMRPRAD